VRKELQAFGQTLHHTVVTRSDLASINFSQLATRETSSDTDSDSDLISSQRQMLRPNHFTFSQDDIVKSFLKAAERERQRTEREEARAKEAARLAREEDDRRARATLHARQRYRPEHVGYELSPSPSLPPTKYLPVPAHFRFSTGDLTKSANKPSQRQAIGHWTTFPRSSTVVLSATQLKQTIVLKVEQIQSERAAAVRAKALATAARLAQKHAQQQKLKPSVPLSPVVAGASFSAQERGSVTAHVTNGVAHGSLRRASLPLIACPAGKPVVERVASSPVLVESLKPSAHAARHSRNNAITSYAALDRATKEFTALASDDKLQQMSLQQEVAAPIRGVHARVASADSGAQLKFDARRAVTLQPTTSVLIAAGTVAATNAQALDASVRRSHALHVRAGSAAESLSAVTIKSAQLTTTPSLLNGHGFSTATRKLLNGSESKSGSAQTSPVLPTKALASTSLYTNVASSGYGHQRTGNSRLL
jgi:hypothetical protein